MRKLLSESSEVVTFIDGACVGNPGPAGCGAVFFSKQICRVRNAAFSASDSEAEELVNEVIEYKYLFGVSMHLGFATSNYAEYMGLILAQIVHAVMGSNNICIKTDS